LALFAGTDGLDVLRPLIAAAAKRLVPGGWLMAEFSPPQQPALREIVAQDDTLESPLFTEDLNQRPRVLRVRRAAT
jgi:release factor glutamine methyltransferase